MARTLSWKGAELILWPTLVFHPLKDTTAHAVSVTRAAENNCYVIVLMRTGQHVGIGLIGHSMIVNPDEVPLAEAAEGKTILVDTIDMDCVTNARTEGAKGIAPAFRHMKSFMGGS